MSKAGWVGPDVVWPRHSRPLAQAALQRARAVGWWVKKSNGQGKPWGVITCGDPELDQSERCVRMVLSTSGPADGSATAEVIDGTLRKCPHDRDALGRDLIAEATELLVKAEKCLTAAERLVDAAGHQELVADYLAQIETSAAEAELLFERAVEMDEASRQACELADDAAREGGSSVSIGAAELAQRADESAMEAKRLVQTEESRDARLLRGRCTDLRARVAMLLARL